MDVWKRTVAWFKAHELATDAVLAVALTVGIVAAAAGSPTLEDGVQYRSPTAFAYALLVLGNAPLIWRRRYPLEVLLVCGIAVVTYEAMGFTTVPGPFGVMVATYTVAAHCDRRRSRFGLAFVAVGVVVVLSTARWPVTTGAIASNAIVFATAWLLGDNLRTRRAYVRSLEERAERAEQTRAAEARRAVAEERTRIARELHDVVAHSMSVMIVQAGAARRILHKDPDKATGALESIESTGREAMTEMRRLLGVLRDESAELEPLVPQPTLHGLQDLLDHAQAAGLDATVTITGEERELPPGVALTAYRIVQEGLTNALKHAGPASAAVHVTYTDHDVEVEVRDDGRGAATAPSDHDGQGLIGMRERVDLFGGELKVGPCAGGGFAVRARLPLEPVAS